MSEPSKLTSPLELLEELKDEIGISSTPTLDELEELVAKEMPPTGAPAPTTSPRNAPTPDAPRSTAASQSPAPPAPAEETEPAEPVVSEAETAREQRLNVGRGAIVKSRAFTVPDAVKDHLQLSELFERVNTLLGACTSPDHEFRPRVPESIEETGLTIEEIEKLVLKYLQQKGSASGRQVCAQIKLPFALLEPLFKQWKQEQLIAYKRSAEVGDYYFAPTDKGRERAMRYMDECSYFGAAPVCLEDYLRAMSAQSIAKQEATEQDLRRAFSDLTFTDEMFERLGPAVNSGRGMFLFGEPGNGKTSIAERITKAFGSSIWIPRTLGIDGNIIRLFDPGVHEIVEFEDEEGGIFDLSGIDQRWVCIVRPTVVAGGELTMDELEVCQNMQTKISEAPLQLKSNCGTLVIDDFGRQTMPVEVLLNRWIVPLEKRYDFLNLPSGKKVQVPFDQLIIFSTNLEPRDLVDAAFLRRIPYKIEVPDPTEENFRKLFEIMAPQMGMLHNPEAVDYLIDTHYKPINRPFRACQPRDLLLQVRNHCVYKKQEKQVTPAGFDFAVGNYFAVM